MATLHVELDVRDYDLWREAFGRDAGGRQKSGVRRYRIFRPVRSASRARQHATAWAYPTSIGAFGCWRDSMQSIQLPT